MHHIYGALQRNGHRRKVAAVNHVIDADGVDGALHCRGMEGHRVEIELRDVACGRPGHDVGLPGTKAHVLSELVAETVTSRKHRQRSPDVGTNQFKVWESLKTAGENKPR